MSVHGPPGLHFVPLELLKLVINANPDPAFHSNADPGSGSSFQK
jgi:hypothetical protein